MPNENITNENIMTVAECADILNMNVRQLREAIENKTFPFGICIKSNKSKIYKISRPAFNRWYNGEDFTENTFNQR